MRSNFAGTLAMGEHLAFLFTPVCFCRQLGSIRVPPLGCCPAVLHAQASRQASRFSLFSPVQMILSSDKIGHYGDWKTIKSGMSCLLLTFLTLPFTQAARKQHLFPLLPWHFLRVTKENPIPHYQPRFASCFAPASCFPQLFSSLQFTSLNLERSEQM